MPFFFNCFAPIFLATVIFIRRIFYPTLFGSDFFGHSHFYKVPFFSTVWLRFFGNSHFINCIVLSCTVAQFFFAAVIFIGCHFFVFNCLVPIFLVTVIFIRRFFFPTLFGSDFLGHSHFCKVPFFATVWLRFFGNSHFIDCIFLPCTVAHFFLATVIFIGCHFLSSTVWLRFFWPLSFLYKAHFLPYTVWFNLFSPLWFL